MSAKLRKALLAISTLLVLALGNTHVLALERGHSKSRTKSQSATASNQENTTRVQVLLAEETRHRLAMLAWYGVFDWLEGQVLPDGTVVLRGQVVRPTTRSDAEATVRRIEGVTHVDNQIAVLPLSPHDDRLRRALYRALFNFNSPLFRYGIQAVPSIHIIVDRGRATLKGVVATKADSQLAYMKARGVPGLFDIKNELRVESEMPR